VPPGIIKLNKRVVSLENLEKGGVRLIFQDGTETTADLVLGADGIRSVRSWLIPSSMIGLLTSVKVVRDHIFPDHTIKFTGRSYLGEEALRIDRYRTQARRSGESSYR